MIEGIRRKIADRAFEYSQHAVDQSILRHITINELQDAIANGEVEEYPDDKYGPSCLIFGFTKSKRPLHIHCSYPTRPLLKIITLYEPENENWVDFKVRRLKNEWNETFVEEKVTYTLEINGKIIIVENVPARVCVETVERLFSPETVERLQHLFWEPHKPKRMVETPVYDYA
jgi:YgiT-type zinc finger domain-containing protein